MPNEHAIAQSYFRADPQALAARRKEQLRRDQLFEQGQSEAIQAEKELERQREQQRRLQEDEQKRRDALAKDAAELATKKRLAETELQYRRAGRPTFTDALGEIRPVDDDATWQAKQEAEKLKQQQDEQAKADTAFRKSEAIRLSQQQKQVASGLTTYKASTALASQASNIKAGQIAADTQRLKHLQNTATTPEQLAEAEAEADAISARIAAAQAEKAQLDDNERAIRLAQTNEELLREPELQAIDQQRTTLPLQHAPDFSPPATQPRTAAAPVAPGTAVPTNLPAQPGTLTPASEDPNKAASVLRGLITRLREKGDHTRADHLEKRLTNPEGWNAEQRSFRATATPQQLAATVEEQAPALAQTAQDIETAYTSLATARQQILSRLDTAKERNAALLAQPYTDADTVVLTDVNTGETTRWHKAAASAYTAAGQALQQWTQENQPQIDLLDIERQNLLIEGENLRKHQNQLDYLAREDQRTAEAKQTSALDSLRQLPGMAEFADESLALTTRAKERLAELETKYPDPTIRSVAQKAVQDDIAAQSTRLQERMEARQAAQRQLYTDFAQGQRVTDWRTENSGLAVTLAQKAKALGLSEQEARDSMEALAAADWSKPRALDQNADPIWEDSRQLPDGSLTVNPTHWLDPEAYTQAVQASTATPEAKQQALDARRELAAPLAAQALLELQKNDTIGRYIEKETTGTPLERMEQLQQKMKAGGAIAASLQRFQGGAAGIAKSAFGLLAAGTDSDWARENAQTFSDRAAGYEALGEMAGKGTGALGRFTSKVVGATPSVLASLAPGGAISAGANALRLGYQAANRLALAGAALTSGAQSAGSTYLDAFNAARAKGLSESEAHASALTPTLLSGGVTTLLTGLSGLRGAESLIARGTQDLFKKTLLDRAKAIGIGFADESLEEGFDQLFQGIIAKATYAPEKPLKSIVEESLEAALIGGVLGGGITTAQEGAQAFSERRGGPRDSQLAPHQLPETLAAAREAIRSTPTLDADQRHRATAALKIAQGRLDIVTDQEAKAMGWFRQDGKWRALKGYTGPAVLDFYNGDPTKPVLLQGYIDTLDSQLPAVHAAIGMDEADLLEMYSTPLSPREAVPVSTASPVSEGSVGTPARSGSPAPASPSTTANGRAATPQPSPTTANAASGSPTPSSPTLESPAEGTPTATPAPVSATAPGGSTAGNSSKQPLNAGAASPQPSPTTANAGEASLQRAQEIANHLAIAGMDPAAAQQIGDYTVRTQGIIGKNYTEQITGPIFANLLDSLGVKGDRRTGANTAPLTAPTDLPQRLANLERTVGTPARSPSASPSPSTTAQSRAAQSTAQPPQTPQTAQTARPPGIAAGAPILQEKAATSLTQRIKSKEITDQDVVLEVARQIPKASTQSLVDILIHQLGIYPQRAKLAVLAAKDSLQSDRIPSSERSVGTPARPGSPSPATNANAREASISALPPARRKRARTTLKALDKALQKWGAAFDRVSYATDPDSPALAAVSENGKMTLQVNLPALLYQFDYLARSEDAVLATLSEEFIHAVALRLAATDPRFQTAALVNLWNRLDPQGRDLIWTTYHNAEIQAGRKPRAVPDTLTDSEKFHMAHETLRLLVQQKAFREQFTEAVGPRRDILRWIKRLLSTLSQRLTKWMRQADPALRSDLAAYRADIIASLAHFEGAYVAETILQAEEKSSSTTANGNQAALQQLQTIANSRPLSPAEESAYAILEAEAAQALLDQTLAMGRAEAERVLPGVSNDIQRRLLARQIQRQAWEAQITSLQARMQRNLEEGSVGTPARSASPPSPSSPTTANASAASQPPPTTANLLPSPAQVSALNIIDALQQRELAAQQNSSPEAARAIRKRLIGQMWEAMVLDISARVERRMAYKAGRLSSGELYQLDDVLRVARGDFQLGTAFSRRNIGSTAEGVPVRPFGYANEATLGRLGIAITENGILYSTDPDSPAYVERNQILIRQSYLDDLAARLPITRQQIAMDEAQARDYFGLPAQATPTTGRNLHEQLPERSVDTPVRSPSPPTTANAASGSQGLPDPTTYGRQIVPAESKLRVDSPGNTEVAKLNEGELDALPDPSETSTPSDSPTSAPLSSKADPATAGLQSDYLQSVEYGRTLEDSIPEDLDIAATADDYLDSLEDPDAPPARRLYAAPRLQRLADIASEYQGFPDNREEILETLEKKSTKALADYLQKSGISDPHAEKILGDIYDEANLVFPGLLGVRTGNNFLQDKALIFPSSTPPAGIDPLTDGILEVPLSRDEGMQLKPYVEDVLDAVEEHQSHLAELGPALQKKAPADYVPRYLKGSQKDAFDAEVEQLRGSLALGEFTDREVMDMLQRLGYSAIVFTEAKTPTEFSATADGEIETFLGEADADIVGYVDLRPESQPRRLFAARRQTPVPSWDPTEMRTWIQGPPVASITGTEFGVSPDKIPLSTRVMDWFQSAYQGRAVHPDLGEIALTARGIKDSWFHGKGAKKASAFAAVPAIIQQGRLIRKSTDYKPGLDRYIIAAPVEIAGEPHTGLVVIQSDANSRRFYLHEVFLQKKMPQTSSKAGTISQRKPHSGTDAEALQKIADQLLAVNPENPVNPDTPERSVGTPARSDSPSSDGRDALRGVPLPSGASTDPASPQTTANKISAAARQTNVASTEAQKEAENYQTGKVTVQGLRLSIENPRNSTRSGTDANGKAWSITMPHHYGRILGTTGADKDHVDFFLGPNPESPTAFIVNQRKPGNGHFDEHKVMLGFSTPGQAARGYLDSYSKGWRGYGSMVAMTLPELKQWLAEGNMSKPATPPGRDALRRVRDPSSASPDSAERTVGTPARSGSPPASSSTANASAASQPPPTTANSSPLPASPRTLTERASAASFNHLDRALHSALSTVAAKVTSTDPVVAGILAMKSWYGADRVDANAVRSIKEFVQGQVIPETVLPREVLSAMRMMGIKIAQGQQQALDVGRALKGNPKFSDIAYPKEFVENPEWRAKLFDAMEGRGAMEDLPEALQKVGVRLRQMLIEAGREAVRQGRMSPDTFEGLRTTYMPRFTQDEAEASAGDWHKAFKLGIRDILAQRSTAYHITDTTRKDKHGLPVLIQHNGSRWRFPDQQARDAFYEDLIQQQMLNPGNLQDMNWLTPADRRSLRAITPEMLKAPALMTAEQRDLAARVEREMRTRYAKENPFTPPKLIKDPVYAIMRYLAQMSHDNATAEFFNLVASNPDWITSAETKGFTLIPDNPRFGVLAGKHVRKDIADQILELAEAPNQFWQLYDTILRLWKTGKTVLNPATHARNIIGNIPFSQLAGNNILNPANAPHYLHALRVLKKGGAEYNQLYETGVLGADYATTELKNALQEIVPVLPTGPAQEASVLDSVMNLANSAAQWAKLRSVPSAAIGGSLGAAVGLLAAGPIGAAAGAAIGAYANPVYRAMLWAYRLEDDLFKAATFFKAKSMGMTPEAAAQHVRDWFPYYDKPSSTAIKWASRSALPFVSFFRESARIGLKAGKERPLSLMTTLAIPSLITTLSAALLGLGDDDLEEVKKDMRGKGAKLLGPTPLAGVPIFSMLLPIRTADGQLQQMDLSSTHPFADFIANRVENFGNQGFLQTWARSIFSNPLMSTGYTVATGKDSFGDRVVLPEDLNRWDYTKALMGHIWKTAVPPIAPGGTNWQTLENAGRRQANKTLALRNPTQAALRSLAGLDIRSADPNIYRMADDFRKARGLPVNETNQAFPTDASGRARKALFEELVQPQPDLTTITAQLQKLNDLGTPVRTLKDVLEILDARRPDGIINPKDLRVPFRLSLPPEARRVLDTALQEFQKARMATPNAFQAARKKLQATTRSLETQD